MNIVDNSACMHLKKTIEALPSVESFKFKAGNGENASVTDFVCRAYLHNDKLIEDKNALYEVPEILNKENISASLDTANDRTYWEFVV